MARTSTDETEPMAHDPSADEWETIQTGLGSEHDFERDGPLVGSFLGSRTVTIDRDGEAVETAVYQFSPDAQPDEISFVWESAEIKSAFSDSEIQIGTRMRIVYLGRDQFTGKNGPQQIKRYRVQVARVQP